MSSKYRKKKKPKTINLQLYIQQNSLSRMKGNEDILKNKGRPENKAPWRKLLKDTHL
jgi:hypothetical protein